jgi:tRNA(fMet)-specific endonuclease VapC
MIYLVDSDWIIEALDGNEAAVQFLASLAPEGIGLSIISYAEVYQGAYYSRYSANDLRQLQRFLIGKRIVGLEVETVERFAHMRGALSPHTRRQVGDLDLLIAATAIEHDLILLTRNVRDFSLIPGVRLFDLSDAS